MIAAAEKHSREMEEMRPLLVEEGPSVENFFYSQLRGIMEPEIEVSPDVAVANLGGELVVLIDSLAEQESQEYIGDNRERACLQIINFIEQQSAQNGDIEKGLLTLIGLSLGRLSRLQREAGKEGGTYSYFLNFVSTLAKRDASLKEGNLSAAPYIFMEAQMFGFSCPSVRDEVQQSLQLLKPILPQLCTEEQMVS